MYYLAYGSNLNVEQMKFRCPGAEIVGTAEIKDYQLMFKGSRTGSYLTIEPKVGSSVPVGVWRVTGPDIASLDRYEGFPSFYYKKSLTVACSDGRRHRSFVYIMHEDRLIGVPSKYYLRTCLAGYSAFGFDHNVLLDAVEYSIHNAGRQKGVA